jgi:Cu-Zn family superoxide dismutase
MTAQTRLGVSMHASNREDHMNLKHLTRTAALFVVAAASATAAVPAVAGDHPARHAGQGQKEPGHHGGGHALLPKTYALPGNALFPEGMGYDRQTGSFYTGSVTDGTIVRGNVLDPQAEVFSPAGADGRTSALGMRTDRSRLYVAGGATGTVWVYNKWNGAFITKLSNGLPATGTTLNDLAVTRSGVFVTDSLSPTLWRITQGPNGTLALEKWLDFTGTAFHYVAGYNADGIAATPDGRYLIVGALNTGKLYRIEIATRAVVEIDTGGADLTNADGIELVDHDLYVARNSNNQIVKLNLADDWASAAVDTITTSPRFDFTVAVAAVGDRLLVLNAQFEHLGSAGGTPTPPTLPFTVTSITRP